MLDIKVKGQITLHHHSHTHTQCVIGEKITVICRHQYTEIRTTPTILPQHDTGNSNSSAEQKSNIPLPALYNTQSIIE